MLSCVRVPVLSMQRTSMLPRTCMASMFLTMARFRDMERLPLARQALITSGSISGVSPTATERAKAKDSSQLPRATPETRNTAGTRTAIKRISTQATEFSPL